MDRRGPRRGGGSNVSDHQRTFVQNSHVSREVIAKGGKKTQGNDDTIRRRNVLDLA